MRPFAKALLSFHMFNQAECTNVSLQDPLQAQSCLPSGDVLSVLPLLTPSACIPAVIASVELLRGSATDYAAL